ncbi:hypothetical protein P7K49_022174 [Saguinus oedipus]|uniref:IF rod domain-containing protein n=1 Tax=Saguinus oedipus TaxID=9490 RepID=A0ABQ9UUR9_SAGOE|nr:hypothetical protein P7K49_022174 [Saguinus oedipus]
MGSYTARSTFSTNYWSLGYVHLPIYCAKLVSSAVRSLETANQRLETKIREHLEKKRPQVRLEPLLQDHLRAQIFRNTVDDACIVLKIDNAHLVADDFRVKYETELAMQQSVESNIYGFHKIETEIEALKEELLFMKKNHGKGSKRPTSPDYELWINHAGRCSKSQDLTEIMADIREQYDELARENLEELDKYWSQQIEESTTVVALQSTEVRAAEIMFTELRHIVQSLKTDLDSIRNLKASLYNSQGEVEAGCALQMEQFNGILLHPELELAQT